MTVEEQEDILRGAGIDLSNAYRDRLSGAAIRRRSAADLKERTIMFRPTSRSEPEQIVVAGLRVLGWSMEDVCDALAAVGRRNGSVYAVDAGKIFTMNTSNVELAQAIADASRKRKREQTAVARRLGSEAARARRNKRRDAIKDEALPLWAGPPGEISGAEIAKRFGITLRTMNNWFGSREEARTKLRKKKEHR